MIKSAFKSLVRRLGFKTKTSLPADFDPEAIGIIERVKSYTMASPPRTFMLIEAVRHVVKSKLAGSIVECGVWRGGSMMAVAYALQNLGPSDRDLYLFDTFEGMSRPSANDVNFAGASAIGEFESKKTSSDSSDWCCASLDEVRVNLMRTGYDSARLKFVKGKVEETIPAHAPDQIAILRLDTDWYDSTRHELIHLYPRLVSGGVLIIDDYGYWQGCRKAVDEYFSQTQSPILLNRIDHTARIAVKP